MVDTGEIPFRKVLNDLEVGDEAGTLVLVFTSLVLIRGLSSSLPEAPEPPPPRVASPVRTKLFTLEHGVTCVAGKGWGRGAMGIRGAGVRVTAPQRLAPSSLPWGEARRAGDVEPLDLVSGQTDSLE